MKYFLTIIILIFTTTLITQGQITDSAKQRSAQTDSVANSMNNDLEPEDDFAPGLLLFALVFIGIIAGAAVFGVAMTTIAMLGIFAMVSFGIVSASIIAGLYTRSVTKGFKVFFILSSIVVGGLFGCTALYTLNFFTGWYNVDDAILLGSAFGLVAGLTGGMITLYFLKRLVAWLKTKITIQTIPK
ncbi:hypothetical protein [Niastella sp. OAS944]|uniref:hypothetical protein n=1 Tax=Niastella sp. OAS944 TaxID=2664089 RepID=UPI0034993F41|nr:hypothetical protein [Chitinophagaceae bacterium OAS944]